MDAILQDQLQNAKGLVPTTDALARKKLIGLYFSAEWCGPCREFTPLFAQVYDDIREQRGEDELEVVYISYDREEEKFKSYFAEMPWLALPYVKRDLKSEVAKRYGIRGVPMLFFVDAQGEVITGDGRDLVEEHGADIDGLLKVLHK